MTTKNIDDGLKNVVANLGTSRDKAAHTTYVVDISNRDELLNAYRASWLAQATVDYPAEDATRNWRSWRASQEQIEKIERLEKKLELKSKVFDAQKMARLYGEALIYINTPKRRQDMPLRTGEKIVSLVVLDRSSLNPGETVKDITSPYYGEPEFYTLQSKSGRQDVKIHASRFIHFYGVKIPGKGGDSVLQRAMDAIKSTDSTIANVASMVFEAKVDVLKVQGFAEMLADNKDNAILHRAHLQAAMKGINGMLMIDATDDYQQKSASFGGLNDVIGKLMDFVSGAARIPVTRLFGRAAVGLSGSGDGDERVYYDRIKFMQENEIGSALALFDECLIYQALGSVPSEIFYEWAPLRQVTESERAEIFQKTASGARSLAGNNAGEIIPINALSDSLVNEFAEQGVLPGIDQLTLKYGSLSEQNDFVEGGDDQI